MIAVARGATVRPRTRPARPAGTLVTAVMIVFLVYFILPLFWMLMASTKSNADLFATFGLLPGPRLALAANLRALVTLDNGVFAHWLLNTVFYASCSAIGAATLAALAGYVFAKFRFPGRRALFATILGSIMVPGTCLAIPLYLLLSRAGLINTPLAVILPSMVSPFGVYLMRVYTEQALPDELLDAARVDGAGELRIFRSVALRLLAPGFVTVLLFSFVGTWNNYFLPLLVLSRTDLYPLTVGLAIWNSEASISGGGAHVLYPVIVTGALVSIVPLIGAFLFLQRYWQGGLTFGGVKS